MTSQESGSPSWDYSTDFIALVIVFSCLGILFLVGFGIYTLLFALITVILALCSLKNRQKFCGKCVGGFRKMFFAGGILIAMLMCFSDASLAAGGIVFFVCLITGCVVNALAARTKAENKTDELYMSTTQGWGVLGLVGYLIASLLLAKYGYRSMISNRYIMPLVVQFGRKVGIAIGRILPIVLFMIGIAMILILPVAFSSLSLVNKKKIKKQKSVINKNSFFGGIFGAVLIAFVCLGAPVSSLIAPIVGFLLTFVGDITYIVLKKCFCKSLDEMQVAACKAHAVPDENEDTEALACIPFLGAFAKKSPAPTTE